MKTMKIIKKHIIFKEETMKNIGFLWKTIGIIENHWISSYLGMVCPPPQFFKKEKKLLLNQRQIQDEATPSPINKNHAI